MDPQPLEQVVRNINERLGRVEQILPTFATKAELHDAVAPLATKVELRKAIREEGERTRQHFDVVAERLEGQIRLIAEGHVALGERIDDVRTELKTDIKQLDRRVTRREARRKA